MNALRSILAKAALAAAFSSNPASAQKVESNYEHSANLSPSHIFLGRVHAPDPLFEGRIHEAIDHALQAKGWQQVPADPDVMLTAIAVQKGQTEYTTFHEGLGGGWRWRG